MQRSDSDLLGLIANGDRAAFADLYDRHARASFGLARHVTRDAQLAEEVVQESFLSVWRQAGGFDPSRSRPSAWLMTITHHKAVDAVRREQTRRTERVPDGADVADRTDVPHEVLLRARREEVRRALELLSETQREVIELAYFSGLSQAGLARHLGVPIGTVKSRTQTALARLRRELERPGAAAETVPLAA